MNESIIQKYRWKRAMSFASVLTLALKTIRNSNIRGQTGAILRQHNNNTYGGAYVEQPQSERRRRPAVGGVYRRPATCVVNDDDERPAAYMAGGLC
jgi:hypothetical protein